MAEMVMKELVRQKGLEKDFYIDSAATDRDEIGNGMHRGTKRELAVNSIPYTDHRARLVTTEDYDRYDLIVCMDRENLDHLEYRIGSDTNSKVHKLMEYCGSSRDVADPWYTGNFTQTYDDVFKGCKALLNALSGN